MRQRTALAGVAALAVLLVSAGVGGAFAVGGPAGPQQAQAQNAMSDTVTVSGSGEVRAQADRAVVRVAVLSTGDDIESVRTDLSENATSMREALTDMGVDESQIRTNHYDISSNERYGPRGEDEPRYRAIHSFTITVEDPDRVGEVIDTAVGNGASEIDRVQFTLSPEKREDLREQALEAAMDAARTEASTVAETEDLEIQGVQRVSTTEFSRSSPRTVAATPASGGASTSISSGPVTVSADVTVVYDVE